MTEEGEQDGDDGRTADDPDTVDAGDGHDTDVFTIGGGGDRAEAAGEGRGETIAHQRAVHAGILHQGAIDNLLGDDEVADMFGDHHKGGGQYG